jgi:hypothetical protein
MSIKNKLVTAITTAGLLAGLFGSAFVPSATGRSSNDTPRAAATEVFLNGGFGANSQCDIDNLYGTSGAASDGCIEPNVKTKNKPNTFRIASYSSGSRSETEGFSSAQDLSIGFYLENAAGDPIETADLTATSTGYVEVAWAYDDNNEESTPKECASEFLDDEAFGLTDTVEDIDSSEFGDGDARSRSNGQYGEGEFMLCIQAKSKNSLGTSQITVTANGVKVATLTIQVIGDLHSLALTAAYPRVAMENGDIHKFFSVVGKDSAGQVINNGADGWAPGMWAGDVDYSNALGDYVDGSFDELGTDDNQFEEHADGTDQDSYIAGGVNATGVTLNENTCIEDALDSDRGKVFNLGVEIDNWDGDLIQSNTIAVTCTGPSDEAILSNITASDVSGEADWGKSAEGKADADGVIAVTAVVKDQAGQLMGKDSTSGFDPGTYDVAGDAAALTTALQIDDVEGLRIWSLGSFVDGYYSHVVGVDGKVILATLRPDMDYLATFRYTVTIDDANQGNSALVDDELKTELFYTAGSGIVNKYALTRTRNAARTVATWKADFGIACSNQFVYFDWENADGTKGNLANGGVSLRRRANANGVATFALAKRNMTVFVTGYSCENLNSGNEELGPVKARFR